MLPRRYLQRKAARGIGIGVIASHSVQVYTSYVRDGIPIPVHHPPTHRDRSWDQDKIQVRVAGYHLRQRDRLGKAALDRRRDTYVVGAFINGQRIVAVRAGGGAGYRRTRCRVDDFHQGCCNRAARLIGYAS